MNLKLDEVTDVVGDDAKVALRAFVTKVWWLDLAEVIDSLRLVARSVLAAQCSFTIWACKALILWYCLLPNDHRGAGDAVAVTSIITVLTTIFVVTLNFYLKQGRVWAGQPADAREVKA